MPYCHVPCYGALFGPQLFGHGTRVESHKSFGQQKESPKINGPQLPRSHLESKLKVTRVDLLKLIVKVYFTFRFIISFMMVKVVKYEAVK